jgi:hypothetical protein
LTPKASNVFPVKRTSDGQTVVCLKLLQSCNSFCTHRAVG